MPLPRFDKLPELRRRVILDAALREFAAHGFADASFNRIILGAGLSKGAVYYYFEDKTDLYLTVVEAALEELARALAFPPRAADAHGYWAGITALYVEVLELFAQRPEVVRMAERSLQHLHDSLGSDRLAPWMDIVRGAIDRLLADGVRVKAVRRDLPRPLLVSLVFAVGETADRWALAGGELQTRGGRQRAAARATELFRRLLEPAPGPTGTGGSGRRHPPGTAAGDRMK